MFNKKDLMNLESIVMLYAVKQNMGKRKASVAMNTSVDTLNKYIENLEHELGVKLLASTEKGSFLTVNGEKVVDIAEKIKNSLRDIHNVVSPGTEVKGEVRVAHDHNARSNLYDPAINDVLDRYPELSLTIDTYDNIPDMLDMKYDISLGYEMPKGDDLVEIFSKQVPYGFFASSGYLANHPYPQDLDDLLENHRLVVKGDCAQWFKNSKSFLQKITQKALKTNNSYILQQIIRHDGGVAILPLHFDKTGLVCLDNIKCDISSTLHLVSHRSTKDVPRVRVVLDYYKNMLMKF